VGPRAGLDEVEKRNFLTLQGLELDPSVVQLVASRYTDYAIPAPTLNGEDLNIQSTDLTITVSLYNAIKTYLKCVYALHKPLVHIIQFGPTSYLINMQSDSKL
jgi:hypothetical protein